MHNVTAVACFPSHVYLVQYFRDIPIPALNLQVVAYALYAASCAVDSLFHSSVCKVCRGMQANFKPGAATWNTDDPDQQPWLKHKKPRKGGKQAEDPAEAAPQLKPVPTAYMTTAKMTESVQTTGECLQP